MFRRLQDVGRIIGNMWVVVKSPVSTEFSPGIDQTKPCNTDNQVLRQQ